MAVVCPTLVYTLLDVEAFYTPLLRGILISPLLSFILRLFFNVSLLLMMLLLSLSFYKGAI